MKSRTIPVASLLFMLVSSSYASLIGLDTFSYPNGTLLALSGYNDGVHNGQAGGMGWANEFTNEGVPNAPSDWDALSGVAPTVMDGKISLSGATVLRQFSGGDGEGGSLDEGSTSPSSEREGAIRGVGQVYFAFRYLYEDVVGNTTDWAGVSTYDFGAERVFFGIMSGPNRLGISQSGIGEQSTVSPSSNSFTPGTTVAAVFGTSYTIVGAVDFDGDRLRMWVNPDFHDFDVGGSNNLINTTADFVRDYTASNWSTAVRLGAGAGATATYDDIAVATTFSEALAAVPEPSSFILLGVGGLLLRRIRRR